jgi:uncharacterized protein
MIRFVASPDAVVVPDLRRKLPGRGAWVTASRSLVAEAIRRKAFARALKRVVVAPATLPDDVERLLAQSARESFSLANKAGTVVSGFSKVEAAIGRGLIAGLIQARDAAPDGLRKIDQALKRRYGAQASRIPVSRALDSVDLDLALGRSHVIHAALLDGPASRACMARFRILERYRGTDGPGAGAGSAPIDETISGPEGQERKPNE